MRIFVALLAALCGAALFERLRVPAGALVGSATGVALVNLVTSAVPSMPSPVRFLLFAGIGWMIGADVTPALLNQVGRAAVPVGLVVFLLLLLGGLLALVLIRLAGIDPATAFLATSPGALSQMTAISAAIGADVSFVVTLHIARIVAVVLVAPFVVRWLPTTS